GFTLLQAVDPAPRAVTLDTEISGALSVAGQVHRLTLDLDEARLLYLDSFTNDYNMLVRIQGPGGVDRTYRLRDADGADYNANPAFKAAAGQYQISIYASGGRTGSYDFQLRDLAQGQA